MPRSSALLAIPLALAGPARAEPVPGDRFVRLERGRPRTAALPPDTRVVALYYGASWCGPCRAFAPELVAAYPALRARRVEVVFVSDDATCRAALDYARASRMPWLLLPCDDGHRTRLRRLGAAALPGLLALDRDGRVLTSSWDARGTSSPRRTLRALLTETSARKDVPGATR
ncbi:thioredoxin-like domain-containing protein [Sphingomonas lenta]|nr:thioredoxin-like domain-containing protein [Sphingomonas lenta]